MPILNIEVKGLQGSRVALAQVGPLVQVVVSMGRAYAKQLTIAGQMVPPPIGGNALIDTGASSTCIDDDVAQQLQLPAIDAIPIMSASHASTMQNVYPAHIEFSGSGIQIEAPRVIGAALKGQSIIALIGRDVLQHAVLVYNGTMGTFSLSI